MPLLYSIYLDTSSSRERSFFSSLSVSFFSTLLIFFFSLSVSFLFLHSVNCSVSSDISKLSLIWNALLSFRIQENSVKFKAMTAVVQIKHRKAIDRIITIFRLKIFIFIYQILYKTFM